MSEMAEEAVTLTQEEKTRRKIKELEKSFEEGTQNALKTLTDVVIGLERQVLHNVLSNPTLNKLVDGVLNKVFDFGDEMDDIEAIDDTTVKLDLNINGLVNVPVSHEFLEKRNIIKSGHCVKVKVLRGIKKELITEAKTSVVYTKEGNPKFNETLKLGIVRLDDTLSFSVNSSFFKNRITGPLDLVLGYCRVRVSDLIQNAVCVDGEKNANLSLWITDPLTDTIVFDYDLVNPTELFISFDSSNLRSNISPKLLAQESQLDLEESPEYPKHVFILTRGTRGDVQPFIALARGLAEIEGWLVTICTEERYRPLVERYSNVSKGKIQFRVSGGDTEVRFDTAFYRFCLENQNDLMQMAFLGRTEREFFDSEPAYFYWAKHMKPDLLIFGFTVGNIAMILSEKLNIPMIGFILQPTFIPSKQYPAVSPMDFKLKPESSHKWNYRMKLFFENNPFDFEPMLNSIRMNRGLEPFSHRTNNLQLILEQNIPLVVPINDLAFGGTPNDWKESVVLTDTIYLRSGSMPEVKPNIMKLIIEARANNEPVVVFCFSSMPVQTINILEMAIMVATQTKQKPRVIALLGNRQFAEVPSVARTAKFEKIEKEAKKLQEDDRLVIEGGAPFSKLFPMVDFVIMGGGLGTTTECLQAGIPCMVSGILLLDQRFWGNRVAALGVGPPPCHIRDLQGVIIDRANAVLAPDSKYLVRAKEIAAILKKRDAGDGVASNVKQIAKVAEGVKPVSKHRESITNIPQRFVKEFAKDLRAGISEEAENVRNMVTKEAIHRTRTIADGIRKGVSSKTNQVQGTIRSTVKQSAFEMRQRITNMMADSAIQRERDGI